MLQDLKMFVLAYNWLTSKWTFIIKSRFDIDGLVQERCNSSALAVELRLSFTNPSICPFIKQARDFPHVYMCPNRR